MVNSTFERELAERGRLVYPNTGVSMLPLLREHRDLMVIEPRPAGRLRVGDAVLFRRGNRYVLHRVLRVRRTDYVIVGDNQRVPERGVKDEQILGILTAVIRDGRQWEVSSPWMRLYGLGCVVFFPARYVLFLFRDGWRIARHKLLQKAKDGTA